MRTKLHLLALIAILSVANAHAVVIPGWERPIYEADLVELDEDGNVIEEHLAKQLTMHRRAGSEAATSFALSEEVQVYCVVAPCAPIERTAVFRVVGSPLRDGCGSVHYKAFESSPADLMDDRAQVNLPRRLTLVDHSTRICKDLRRFRWDVQIDERDGETRHLGGNPTAVYTIQ